MASHLGRAPPPAERNSDEQPCEAHPPHHRRRRRDRSARRGNCRERDGGSGRVRCADARGGIRAGRPAGRSPAAPPLADLPSAQAKPDLPMLFVFEGPTVNTSGPARTSAPADTSAHGGAAAPTGQASTVQRIPGSDQAPGTDGVPALGAVATRGRNRCRGPRSPAGRSPRCPRSTAAAVRRPRAAALRRTWRATAGRRTGPDPSEPQPAISIRSRHSTHPARHPPHSPLRLGARGRSAYQQNPVIIVTMASGTATIIVASAVSSVNAPNAMVRGATRRITGPPGSSMP